MIENEAVEIAKKVLYKVVTLSSEFPEMLDFILEDIGISEEEIVKAVQILFPKDRLPDDYLAGRD